MSRFDEVCESYQKLLSGAEKYENECKIFAQNLANGFIEFLECGRNDLSVKEFNLDEDGYYNFFIELTVYQSTDTYALKGYVPEIPLKIARNNNEFLAKVSTGSQLFVFNNNEIGNTTNQSFTNFYDYLYRGIKSYYETPIDDFIHRNMKGIINFG